MLKKIDTSAPLIKIYHKLMNIIDDKHI